MQTLCLCVGVCVCVCLAWVWIRHDASRWTVGRYEMLMSAYRIHWSEYSIHTMQKLRSFLYRPHRWCVGNFTFTFMWTIIIERICVSPRQIAQLLANAQKRQFAFACAHVIVTQVCESRVAFFVATFYALLWRNFRQICKILLVVRCKLLV